MKTRLPTIDETIAEARRRAKLADAPVTPIATPASRAATLRKLAAAVRALPEAEPTFEDLYTVKAAFYGDR